MNAQDLLIFCKAKVAVIDIFKKKQIRMTSSISWGEAWEMGIVLGVMRNMVDHFSSGLLVSVAREFAATKSAGRQFHTDGLESCSKNTLTVRSSVKWRFSRLYVVFLLFLNAFLPLRYTRTDWQGLQPVHHKLLDYSWALTITETWFDIRRRCRLNIW